MKIRTAAPLVLIAFLLSPGLCWAQAQVKTELVQRLTHVLVSWEEKVRGVDQQISDLIEDSAGIKTASDPMYENLHLRLIALKEKRKDLAEKVGFLERLRGQIVDLYEGQDLRAFLQARLSAMARNSFGVNAGIGQHEDGLGEWIVDLKISLGQSSSEGAALLEFLIGAIENLPLENRTNPVGVVESAQYTNGARWEKAVSTQEDETTQTGTSQPSAVGSENQSASGERSRPTRKPKAPVVKQIFRVQELVPPVLPAPVVPKESPAENYE